MKFALPFTLILLLQASVARADDAPPDEAALRKQAIELLSAGKQAEAEKLVFTEARQHPSVKIYFFSAVLVCSRFDVKRADGLFARVFNDDPNSTEGQVASLVVAIDNGDEAERHFQALDQFATAHAADPLILWMVAVECRQLNKPKIGIERYTKLLTMLNPGPALVHQTLGNLLIADGQAAAALREYDNAIAMEPACWDFNCRGNALMALGRFDEAAAAYQKSTELNPDYAMAWGNWATLCYRMHDYKGAAEIQARRKPQ